MAEKANDRRRRRAAGWTATVTAAALMLSSASDLPAQSPDSTTVVAGPRYAGSGLKRFLLGDRYRELWTTPIRVPVLRPDTFAGGLTVIQRGTSPQTLSLRFLGGDGREYVFRSVDKEQNEGLPPDLHNTLTADVIQDLVSAKHPAAALIVAPLLEAAGVLHARPRFAMMADHPLLGEHRDPFAGMLGMIEERPNEEGDSDEQPEADEQRDADERQNRNPVDEPAEENGRTAGAVAGAAGEGILAPPGAAGTKERVVSPFDRFSRIIGSERLQERLEESPVDRVDARAYLAARLVDFLVGDWDRHPDQWRWAEEPKGATRFWLPIPRDRDNALSHVNGAISLATMLFRPIKPTFGQRYSNVYGLIHNAQPLDRPILSELPRAAWDSVAGELRQRITDAAIAAAIDNMPAAWAAIEGERLESQLRARRDALPEIAREIYGLMAEEVDVYGTDEADRAEVEQLDDGRVRVRLSAADGEGGGPYFERVFVPAETREVRIHLLGGPDQGAVSGTGGRIHIRILGGGGDDVLEDFSPSSRQSLVAFYDNRGDNRIVGGRGTVIDRRAFERPEPPPIAEGNAPPARDWGSENTSFVPRFDWEAAVGPVVGGGPSWTRYGFRRFPYARRAAIAVLLAPLDGKMGVEAGARFIRTGGSGETRLTAHATQISAIRFYGFGNETPYDPDPNRYRVWATEYTISAHLVEELAPSLRISLGPVAAYLDPRAAEDGPAVAIEAIGTQPYGVGGLTAAFTLDRRDSPSYPRKGMRVQAETTGYPLVWGDVTGAFAKAGVVGAAHLPLPGPFEPTLAFRAGGDRTWGPAPIQYAAFLGGKRTLRGHASHRFAGDAAIYGGSELRTKVGRANLLLVRPEMGVVLLADAGRVYMTGERSERWHTAYGGGLWFGAFDRFATAHLIYAYGDRHSLHAGLGVPF